MAQRTSRPVWLKVSTILIAILLLASPMLIGGVHALSALVLVLLALVAAVISDRGRGVRPTSIRLLSIPAAVFGLFGVTALVQALPLPAGLVGLLSPNSARALELTWEAAYGSSPQVGFRSLSLDARASTAHALKWFALCAAALAASNLGRWRGLRRQGIWVAVAAAALVALAGVLQALSGTEKMLGVYQASLSPRAWAPFVSTNHAATYYGLAALMAGGGALVWARRHRPLAAALMVSAAIFGSLAIAHRSQGALLALGAGALAAGAMIAAHATRQRSQPMVGPKMLLVLGVLAAALTAAALLLPEHLSLAEPMGQTSLAVRLHLSKAALSAAGDFWLTGAGAGAVSQALPAYLDPHLVGMHSVPTIENEPVEWLFGFGLLVGPAGLLLLAMSIFYLVRSTLRASNPLLGALSVGLAAALAMSSVFHFPFFTLGISLPVVMLIELCTSRHGEQEDGYHRRLTPRAYRLVLAGLGTATLLTAALHWGLYAEDSPESGEPDYQHILARYPTDVATLTDLSVEARQAGEYERALALAERALALNPFPQQGLVVARALAANDRHQEAAERWRALYAEPHLAPASWLESFLLRDLRAPELRARALGRASEMFLAYALDRCAKVDSPQAAAELGLALLGERPTSPAVHLGLTRIYRELKLWELSELWASQLLAQDLREAPQSQQEALRELLQIYHRLERPEEAERLARRALSRGWLGADAARDLMATLPPATDPEDATTPRQALLLRAYEIGCAPPLRPRDQRICWRNAAAFAEAAGELRRAQMFLERVSRKHHDPRDLGRFLVRQKNCVELATLVRQYGQGPHRDTLRRLQGQCAR
ncbi:hypothetical protein DL240_17065 [Lujinxingia litoralis]|uniref:Uncharacterized protein n=1 Tax=Lujinxingia litoralis TaxID=2211119 RepID=A0A328C689_9DELT|nr:hypothetical protein [Lujinxingia litoralis]RAL20510.1 hypothetical protein DL240_17065 [Lujinxingia litoralis]